uniref:HAT C-terminal dimerisation domain-containing protein n=1 Tax=Glycine max TaxID=3847 RepID=A0A0R0HQX4_SOYBN
MTTKKSGTTYSTSGSGNMTNIRDFEFGESIGCDGRENDEFADSCNATASAKTKCGTKKGPMEKFCKNLENAINRRKMEMLRQMNIRESMDKNEVLKVHQHIARFWYQASVDGSDFLKTSEKIFELLDAIVEEVGEESVVQVVTDNGSNYVLEGKLLEEKRKHIYWTPCATYFGFIYTHSSILSLLRNFINKRELVRHAITRFATSYLTLERLHKEKTNIRKMFTSDEWTLNKLSKEPKGKEAAKVVLMPFFWNSVVYTLKVMAPLVKVLRLVDGEKKPAMGYIYEAMDKAKETIIKSFNNNESKYKDVFAIIDKRWNFLLHRPLHAAAHFLNPKFFYDNTDLEFDFEVTNGLFECIKKLIPQFDVQQKILTELHLYKIGAEHFGFDFAMAQRKTHSPTYWWRMFGSQTPNLQKLAIKILSLTSSVSGCERNWSVFEQHKRLHDLVFVKYNQQLKQGYNARDEIDPISLNDIDVCNEWIAMVVGSSSRKQKAVQENDEDLDFEENIDLESEEEEIMVNFEASDGEEGEGDAPLPYDNNEDDYVGIGEDD